MTSADLEPLVSSLPMQARTPQIRQEHQNSQFIEIQIIHVI